MSASSGIGPGVERLGNDAHVGDAGLLDGVHDGGEGAEGNILIGADEDALALGIANFGVQAGGDFVDVDRIVAQKDALVLVDGDDQALFGDLLDGFGLGHIDLDAGLKDRGGDHEHDQEHEHNVDKGSDVDVRERGLGASLVVCKRHRSLLSWVAVAVDDVEQFEAEVVHAGGEFADLLEEKVIGDDGGHGGKESGGGGDERLGDAGRHRAQGGRTGVAEAVEGVDDAPDGAEESDEGSNGAGGGQPGEAALQAGQLLGGGDLGGALHGKGAGIGATALQFGDGALKDGHQGRGLELLGHVGEFLQTFGAAEDTYEASALHPGATKESGFGDDDRPGKKTEGQQNQEDDFGDQAGLGNHLHDLGTKCESRSEER